MELTPHSIYQQSLDKQRVVIIGSSNKLIGNILQHVLKFHKRKFDYVADKQVSDHFATSEAPVVLIESNDPNPSDYHHHIGVLSNHAALSKTQLESFCNATPKSGILFFPEGNAMIKEAATKERPDVVAIPYKIFPHEKVGNVTQLLSSKKVKVPVTFSDAAQLEAASAAKEVLKKIGITSDQFYQAISEF